MIRTETHTAPITEAAAPHPPGAGATPRREAVSARRGGRAFMVRRSLATPSPNDLSPEATEPERHPDFEPMVEFMRAELCRCNCVTEEALRQKGYTMAQITEFGDDAFRTAKSRMERKIGEPGDRLPEIIAKAIAAKATEMPAPSGSALDRPLEGAWIRYCVANAAHGLDPWVSQAERTLRRLEEFLTRLPLLPSERNRAIADVAVALKVRARDAKGGAA